MVYLLSELVANILNTILAWCIAGFQIIEPSTSANPLSELFFSSYAAYMFDLNILKGFAAVAVILFAFMCMSLGHLSKHYVMSTLGYIVLIYHMLLVPYIAVSAITFSLSIDDWSWSSVDQMLHNHYLLMTIPYIILPAVIFYFITYFILSKKLNLS